MAKLDENRPMAGKSAEEFYQNLEPLKEGDELFFGRHPSLALQPQPLIVHFCLNGYLQSHLLQ